MYDSWASRIRLFIKGKKHGRMMLDSIDNDDYDLQATNIILHDLPTDVLYNLFNKFAYVQDETLYEYYWRFSQLINDMHTIGMTMQQVQVNTKFLNALPSEWSKFVTDVKLAKSLYTTNYDQLYAYLTLLVSTTFWFFNVSTPQQFTSVYAVPIHHQKHHTPVNPVQQSVSLQPFISLSVTQQPQAEFPQLDSGLAVPTFQQGEDPIDYINKVMAFLSTVASRGITTTSRGNYAASQPRVVKCYNCQGEGHMARQCTQPKRPRSVAWFKEKLMLAEAQEAGQILDEEQLAFLADLGIEEALVAQQTIPRNSTF
ncbi:putative reverse transcriptase domain-containing protein [Tanacetum coccineum]